MQEFMKFLQEYEKVIEVIEIIFFFVISIMLYRKTGNVKYLTEAIEEMKYRTPNYNVTEIADKKTGEVCTQVVRATQSFDKLVPIYRLNKATGELEKTDDYIDIQEQIESFKEMALNNMLERFMPKLVDETADFTQVQGDLDFLTESINVAEEYREKFNLPETMTIQEIYKEMDKYKKQLGDKIELMKKGGNEGETQKIVEKGE